MSASGSPNTSSIAPTCAPAESTTSQPRSTTFQEAGSATSDRPAGDVPHRTLRARRMRVGERTQNADATANAFVVEPLERALHHSRRGAVAERVRAPEREALVRA